ncbi:RNA polymerase sigma-70 factor (ECF subfamily) [Comamonas sp. BIGb0124]|uniref:sigma-70 family RNA polymerase sigma factor n=1 Tax=Comamonas sp. BIGb0124 TaxID=2485130 RepID=UPI000FB50D81|nr:sigma-70 family RNA polymerase sigma factor [Comamonas sp. BIGb0124]ROR22507.1 RNA polymerase sigma-70 factor (ECF subfamily) [Comamonas sp. BIGb0124]
MPEATEALGPNTSTAVDSTCSAMAVLDSWFRSHHGWLLTRIHNRLRNRAEAEDLAAESFAQAAAIQAKRAGLEEIREPRAFLTTIAKRQLFQFWRRRDLEQAYLDALAAMPEDLAPSPEERHTFLQALEQVYGALEGLSAKARQAFFYSQIDGLTYSEIAVRLGVSPSMVRQYMAQGFRRIADLQSP